MRHSIKTILLTAGATLALAACGSEDVENTPVDDIDELVDADQDDDFNVVGGELNETQRANYEGFDRQATSGEYDANMETIRGTGDGRTGTGAAGMTDRDSAASSDGNRDPMSGGSSMAAGGGGSDAGSANAAKATGTSGASSLETMPRRSQMDFTWLDRNADGRLSVAEYAIWALPANPTEPAPNDAIPPYLTDDEINEAAQTFFYFDDDGDTYLSPEEFQDARNSTRV